MSDKILGAYVLQATTGDGSTYVEGLYRSESKAQATALTAAAVSIERFYNQDRVLCRQGKTAGGFHEVYLEQVEADGPRGRRLRENWVIYRMPVQE